MKCELIQPDLLDYSKGLLSRPGSEAIRTHLEECEECRALLAEEISFDRMIAALPEEEPANDVWTLVRASTKPRRFSPVAFLHDASRMRMRRLIAASATMVAVLGVLLAMMPSYQAPVVTGPKPAKAAPVVAASDEPLSQHTDAMLAVIEKM